MSVARGGLGPVGTSLAGGSAPRVLLVKGQSAGSGSVERAAAHATGNGSEQREEGELEQCLETHNLWMPRLWSRLRENRRSGYRGDDNL